MTPMSRTAPLLCTLAWMVMPLSLAAGMASATDAPLRLVSVSGVGETKAQPDMAYVTIGVEARKPTVNEARTQVNATVERLLALTRELKIDPKQVDSTQLQVQPDYRWDEATRRQVLQGYLVNRQLEVEVRDLERLGTLLEKAVTAGANQVGGARLDSSRRKELEREALALAVEDARLKADTLAQAAGVKLGPVQNLSAAGSAPMPMFAERAMMAAAPPAMDAADQSYQAAEMKFTANVSAQYELRLP
jgi:uncharacterized protein YggE